MKIETQIYIAVSCPHYNPNNKSPQCLECYYFWPVKCIVVDFKFMLYTIFSSKQVLNEHLWKINHGILSLLFFELFSTSFTSAVFCKEFDFLLRWSTFRRHWFNQFTFQAFSRNTLPLVITILDTCNYA